MPAGRHCAHRGSVAAWSRDTSVRRGEASVDVELQLGEAGIEPVLLDQLLVGAGRHHAAVIHDHDPVGLEHGRQAVRDDQRRPPAPQLLERLLNQPLALGVERAGRLVEKQHRRIAEDRTRDRDPLALAARQANALLAQEAVEAFR